MSTTPSPPASPRTLAQWLEYQQRTHPQPIALGLDRVEAVARRLGATRPAPIVITVGGTNGKGSTVAFIEAIARAAGHRVGAFTSPHLLRYNERVRIEGREVDDDTLCAAFARIEHARGETPLTYFEFGTLAALDIFTREGVDVAVLEVGLGGRLDAVNLVDADAAVVTTVDLDHQEYLGRDREMIGREKAGIFRPGRPAVIGEARPPESLLEAARGQGALLARAGETFFAQREGDGWSWRHVDGTHHRLPLPRLRAPAQIANAAAAIAVMHALRDRLPVPNSALSAGVLAAAPDGRLQCIAQAPEVWLDVGHNPQAAREIAAWLIEAPRARTVAVFAALGDKDIPGIVAPLAPWIAHWRVFGLQSYSPRGIDAAETRQRVLAAVPEARVDACDSYAQALTLARADAGREGRVLVFGSFFTVACALNDWRNESSTGA